MLGKDCKIQWDKRYSKTDYPDDLGRWARVGYLNSNLDSIRIEIAWIKKHLDCYISYVNIGIGVYFKNNIKTLEEAKMFCEISLNDFKNKYL
jgi:hypothetical protein